jgi:uncharacterized protein (DUF1800 family)
VDGGYAQQDVQAMAPSSPANCRGGAGRLRGGEPGRFHFRPLFHQPGAQLLLGRRYAEGGVEQGEAALRDLALHPRTAHHIAGKLARHFVADDPSPGLVARLQQAYLDSRGDLRAVYGALVSSPEAWQSPLAKFKTPTDYIYSTHARCSPIGNRLADLRVFVLLGQRPFQLGSPAGWPDRRRLGWFRRVAEAARMGAGTAAPGSSRKAVQVPKRRWAARSSTHTSIARAQDGPRR